ncbi:MAG: hypothetical protein KDJ69_10060 [Nitratireductor sp.]|nr:hypothetical protein [Nitratireductor sp.]
MIWRFVSPFLPAWATPPVLVAIVMAILCSALAVQTLRLDAAAASAAGFKIERDNLKAVVAEEQGKRRSLAGAVIEARARLDEQAAASAEIQKNLIDYLEFQADLAGKLAEQADAIRAAERKDGREVRTFDTRGLY